MTGTQPKTITRIEVIDYTKPLEKGGGRAYVYWEKDPVDVQLVYQDNNRTLKIFINK